MTCTNSRCMPNRPAIARLIVFLSREAGCRFLASLRESGEWRVCEIDAGEAEQAVLREGESPLTPTPGLACPHAIKVADAIGVREEGSRLLETA